MWQSTYLAMAGRETCCSRCSRRPSRAKCEERWTTSRYTCGEIRSDRVEIAVVQKGIGDEDLRSHLIMHAARFSSSCSEHLSCSVPADVSVVYKTSNDKDYEPSANHDADEICCYCRRKRHRKQDRWTMVSP